MESLTAPHEPTVQPPPSGVVITDVAARQRRLETRDSSEEVVITGVVTGGRHMLQ